MYSVVYRPAEPFYSGNFLRTGNYLPPTTFTPRQTHPVGPTDGNGLGPEGTPQTPAPALDISMLMATFIRTHPCSDFTFSHVHLVLIQLCLCCQQTLLGSRQRQASLLSSFPLTSMSQVLRFNSTDPRVTYAGQWVTNWRQNGTSSSATQGAQFFLLFRGKFIQNGFIVYSFS